METKNVLSWVVKASLALSLLYSVLFIANGLGMSFFALNGGNMTQYAVSKTVVSPILDPIILAVATAVPLAWLFFSMYLNKPRGRRKLFLLLIPTLLLALAGLQQTALLSLTFASVSTALLSAMFSRQCFGLSASQLARSLVLCSCLIVLSVEAASFVAFFVIYNPNVSSFSTAFVAGMRHWILLDMSLPNVAYPLLPLTYLFFVFLEIYFIYPLNTSNILYCHYIIHKPKLFLVLFFLCS